MSNLNKDFAKKLSEILRETMISDGAIAVGYVKEKILKLTHQREKELLELLLEMEKKGNDLKLVIELQLKGDIYKTDEELSNE